LEETAQQIQQEGGQVMAIPCDVSDSASVQAMVTQTAERFGHIDLLVNNAGVRASIGTILELTEEEWQRTFDIDAKGSWLCSKYVIPELRKVGGGSIIMVSSVSAYYGQIKQGAYNAAKAAQEALMKCMALDFAPDNIRVNSICPAWVLTEMNREQLAEMKAQPEQLFPPGFRYADVVKLHPIGRLGEAEDVAWAAVYLASDESKWVTGASLFVDGGFTCQ
jgi:NAD(P)-dependent dehydrogenase (short-subunit alcohol dehydrogenase family)